MYTEFREARFIDRDAKLFDTIPRTKLKNFKSVHADKTRSTAQKQNDLKKENAEVQRIIDIARIRQYDMEKLFSYDLVPSMYLFEDDLMKMPSKYMPMQELEKSLSTNDYILPSDWPSLTTTYIIDVMQFMRKVGTKGLANFNEFFRKEFMSMITLLCPQAKRIDFVFDSYVDGSAKDTERERRSSVKPIEITCIACDTPVPIDMDTFWPSNTNKKKLQAFSRVWIKENVQSILPGVKIVLSGTCIGKDGNKSCEVIENGESNEYAQLDFNNIEEADIRIVPHAFDASSETERIVILSNDTDVAILSIHFAKKLEEKGIKEVWLHGGVANSTRYIPINTLAGKPETDLCKVLPAVHNLTGCDVTSKVGTKAAALKAHPMQYLDGFGMNAYQDDFHKIEEYLVQVMKIGTQLKTMDALRYYTYHRSKNMPYSDLPPTSRSLFAHIQRSLYVTFIQMNCMENPSIDACEYGFVNADELLVPIKDMVLLPDDLPQACICGKCATKRCICRVNKVACCMFCKCRGEFLDGRHCKNPNMILRVPITMPQPHVM